VAYRGDVHEIAFSSARLLQAALQAHGAIVYVDDPLYSREELTALGYTPMPLEAQEGTGAVQAIIAQAAHSAYRSFDLGPFTACRVVLDGRRVLSQEQVEARGIRYLRIGDGQASVAASTPALAN
jgi:UDP-N-acetyl-D-mannosaminuronate dehydrogenase